MKNDLTKCVKCSWIGWKTQQRERDDGDYITLVCPGCGCDSFYLEEPVSKVEEPNSITPTEYRTEEDLPSDSGEIWYE